MSRQWSMKTVATLVIVVAAVSASAVVALAARCGDCDDNGTITIGEVSRCGRIFSATLPLSNCPNCDQSGNGVVSIGEVSSAGLCFSNPNAANCKMVTPGAGSNTPTNTVPLLPTSTATSPPPPPTSTNTNTPVPPTNTFTATATNTPPPNTPTATPTVTQAADVCGDGVKTGTEECDDGGTCFGGSNAGTHCTAESQCLGQGVCEFGGNAEAACDSDADCPDSRCVHCKPVGGDGCAANCTMEREVIFNLVPGSPANNPAPGTSAAVINGDGLIKKLPLPLNGGQRIVAGGKRNGMITLVTRASQAGDAVKLGAIKVGTLACACVRGIAAKSCGGTLRNKDGSLATDCTPQFTKGDSLCAGTGKACAFVHGPGLSATGVIGCNGLAGTDLTFTQDAGGMPLPPPGTPPIGAGPPIITLSGSGGPGSFVLINSSAIGQAQTTSFSPKPNVCDAHSTVGTVPPDFGPDKIYCTDDDPNGCVGGSSPGAACDSDADCPGSGTCVHARGAVQSLPVVSGTATGEVFNVKSPGSNFGPFSITGGPFGCDLLLAPTPVITGAGLAGAFVALNQPQLGDIIVTNLQFSQ